MLMHLNKILKVQPQRWMALSVSIDLGWLVGWLVGGGVGKAGDRRTEAASRTSTTIISPFLKTYLGSHIFGKMQNWAEDVFKYFG